MAGTIRESVRLLTIWGGFVAKPGLLSGVKAGADTYDIITKLAKTPDASLNSLGDRLADEAETVFRQYRDAPPDAEVLYTQMVEKGLPDAKVIAGASLNPEQVVDRMLETLSLREHRTAAMQGLFRQVTEPVLAELLGNPAFFAEIEPAAIAKMLERQEQIQAQLDQLVTEYGSLATAMQSLTKVPRDQMEALALRFEIEGIIDRSDTSLRQVLEQKAEEYRNLKVVVTGLKGLSKRINNIHVAALDAVERLDLDEASRLVADAREIQTQEVLRPALETNAKLMETQADIELLRGRADQAYEIFTIAAESFRALDIIETARRRVSYMRKLRDHGQRFSGRGIFLSLEIIRPAVDALDGSQYLEEWANSLRNLGMSLVLLSYRTSGAEGVELLTEAINNYSTVLSVFNEAEYPEKWAKTQRNIGVASAALADRCSGTARADHLDKSIAAFQSALRVFTENDYPSDWAKVQINLGGSMYSQGELSGDPDGLELLSQAADAYRAALRVSTEAEYPEEWADTQQALGNALWKQGDVTSGHSGADLLESAVVAHHAALRVYSESDHPVEWSRVQQNLGLALMTQAGRSPTGRDEELYDQAVLCYRAALRVRTEVDRPLEWATTQNNLGIALNRLGHRARGARGMKLVLEAEEAYRAALRIRTRADHPLDWASTQINLASFLFERGEHSAGSDGMDLMEQSIKLHREVLEAVTPSQDSRIYASANFNLALTMMMVAIHETTKDPRPSIEAALGHAEAALTIYDCEHANYEQATQMRDVLRDALVTLDQ